MVVIKGFSWITWKWTLTHWRDQMKILSNYINHFVVTILIIMEERYHHYYFPFPFCSKQEQQLNVYLCRSDFLSAFICKKMFYQDLIGHMKKSTFRWPVSLYITTNKEMFCKYPVYCDWEIITKQEKSVKKVKIEGEL